MVIQGASAEHADKLTLELRRGTLVLATLCLLRSPKYGYSLVQDLGAQGLEVDQGTLYPLLRRLDDQGVLESTWNVEGVRPRKYYQLSTVGSDVLESLAGQWKALVGVLDGLLEKAEGDHDGTD